MASVEVDPTSFRVNLGRLERLGALHGDLEATRAQVAGAQAVDDLWEQLRGIRAPGTGIPRTIMLGTTRKDGAKDFCVVYGKAPGLLVELRDHEFARVLVSMPLDDAVRYAKELSQT